MEVTVFEKEGKKVWESATGAVSMCLKIVKEAFDPETGWFNTETTMNWIKGRDIDAIERQVAQVKSLIEAGSLVPYRVYSTTAFYEGQAMDINPQTNESMNRYSETRLGAVAKANKLHRQFIEPVEAFTPPVEVKNKVATEL